MLDNLTHLTGLKSLTLDWPSLKSFNGQFHQLEELSITHDVNFTDNAFKQILTSSPNLKVVKLHYCDLTHDAFQNIKELKKLKALEIENCDKISDKIFSYLPTESQRPHTEFTKLIIKDCSLISEKEFDDYKTLNTGVDCTFEK